MPNCSGVSRRDRIGSENRRAPKAPMRLTIATAAPDMICDDIPVLDIWFSSSPGLAKRRPGKRKITHHDAPGRREMVVVRVLRETRAFGADPPMKIACCLILQQREN